MVTDNLMIRLRSQSIRRPTKFMSPIQLTSGYRYLIRHGKFLTKWSVPEWGQPVGFEDLAIDSQTGRLYASSAHLDAVLVFDLNGTRIGSLTPKPPDRLEGPSAPGFDRPEAVCAEHVRESRKRDRSVNEQKPIESTSRSQRFPVEDQASCYQVRSIPLPSIEGGLLPLRKFEQDIRR